MSFEEDVVKRVLVNPGWLQEWKPSHPRGPLTTPTPHSLTLWFPAHQTTGKSPRTLNPDCCSPHSLQPRGSPHPDPRGILPPLHPPPPIPPLCSGSSVPGWRAAFWGLSCPSVPASCEHKGKEGHIPSPPAAAPVPQLLLSPHRPCCSLAQRSFQQKFLFGISWAPPLTLPGVESLGPPLHRHWCWQQEEDEVRSMGRGLPCLLKSTHWSVTRRPSERDPIWKWSCCRCH